MQSSLRWQRTAGPDQSRALHCCGVNRCSSRVRRVSAAVPAEHRQVGRAADRHAAKRRAIIARDAQISVETGSRDVSASADLTEEEVVLVGDIGGTNCRLVLWKIYPGLRDEILFSKVYPTKDYAAFEDALDEFYAEPVVGKDPPQSAALAVAGPVVDNRCKMTNLSWLIDGHDLSRRRGVLFAVLNDFEAVGYGVPVVPQEDLVVLHEASVSPKSPKAVLGPGTGLGEAMLIYEEGFDGYRVVPSEGSHATFAPRGWKQRALQAFAEAELGQHCEVEHVACGSGLERIHRFLQSDPADCEEKTHHVGGSDWASLTSPSPGSISRAALDGSDPLALEAVDMFLAILGCEAGFMGLRLLATGGVYICGGIGPKLLKRIKEGGLTAAFLDEGCRFEKLLRTFPLFLVTNEQVGLLGAREYAIKLLTMPGACKQSDINE